VRDAESCRTLSSVRIAVAALLLSGCAAPGSGVTRAVHHRHPAVGVCGGECGAVPAKPPNVRIVYGAKIYTGFAEELEKRWGVPLESTLPEPVLSPSDEISFSAWLHGVEPAVIDALRIEIDREYTRHVEEIGRARARWLDALAGSTPTPTTEAKFLLDAAVDAALQAEADAATDRGFELFLAKTSDFTFPSSHALDMETLTEGTKLEPVLVQDISRARLAEPTWKLRMSMARARSSEIATRLLEKEQARWSWARKKS
jgi:hypothetical protein